MNKIISATDDNLIKRGNARVELGNAGRLNVMVLLPHLIKDCKQFITFT